MRQTAMIVSLFIFILVFLIGIYAGIGGLGNEEYNSKLITLNNLSPVPSDTVEIVSEGISYKNKIELQKSQILIQKAKFEKIYPWLDDLPDLIILLITCCSFSLIGSYILIVRELALKTQKTITAHHIIYVINGLLTGLIVLGLSYLLPLVLINDNGTIRPATLMFLSLFGGLYSNKLFEKLSGYVDQIFKAD